MKKSIKALFLTLLLAVLLVPSVKANAAEVPPAPTGLGYYGQDGSTFAFSWDINTNISLYSDVGGYYGYEIQVLTLKDKNIKTYNMVDDCSYTYDTSKWYAKFNNSSLQKKGFKVRVRAYVYDASGNMVYSDYSSAKIIIPRSTITKKKVISGKKPGLKISWKKISGAKSYTVYLSSNNGKSFKKKGTTKKSSYSIKNLKRYKDYYVYVAANGVKSGKKKYSSTKPTIKASNAYGFYIYSTYK